MNVQANLSIVTGQGGGCVCDRNTLYFSILLAYFALCSIKYSSLGQLGNDHRMALTLSESENSKANVQNIYKF